MSTRRFATMFLSLSLCITLAHGGKRCAAAVERARVRNYASLLEKMEELEAFIKDSKFPINNKETGEGALYMYWFRHRKEIDELLGAYPEKYDALRNALNEREGGEKRVVLDVFESEFKRLGKVPGSKNKVVSALEETSRDPFPWIEMYYENWDWMQLNASPLLKAAVGKAGWKKGSLTHLKELEEFIHLNKALPKINRYDSATQKAVRIPVEGALRGAMKTHMAFIKEWGSPELLALIKEQGL